MAQAMVEILEANISKNPVTVKETFILSVKILELTPDGNRKLPLKLGGEKGVI